MAAYNLLDERHEAPLSMAVRGSVEGQNNFQRSFTENFETIFSRTILSRAQLYVVPTASFNAPRLLPGGRRRRQTPDLPGINTFALPIPPSFHTPPSGTL